MDFNSGVLDFATLWSCTKQLTGKHNFLLSARSIKKAALINIMVDLVSSYIYISVLQSYVSCGNRCQPPGTRLRDWSTRRRPCPSVAAKSSPNLAPAPCCWNLWLGGSDTSQYSELFWGLPPGTFVIEHAPWNWARPCTESNTQRPRTNMDKQDIRVSLSFQMSQPFPNIPKLVRSISQRPPTQRAHL